MILFKKDDVLRCRKCGVDLLKAKKDIFTGDMSNPEDFSSLHPKLNLSLGALMECPDCKYAYLGIDKDGTMVTDCIIR